jgi:hypothetical protein
MCKSQAEGGKRCATHTRRDYQRERAALAGLPADATEHQVLAQEDRYQAAAREYALTPSGKKALTVRLEELRAGATEQGDRLRPLAAALNADLDALRSRDEQVLRKQARRAAFAEALRTGDPVPVDHQERLGRTTVESPLAAQLRTGDHRRVTPADLEQSNPREPYAYGDVVVPEAQRTLIEMWGPEVPVAVTAHRDLQEHHGGWSEVMPDGSTRHIADADREERADRTRVHGSLTVTNRLTGEQRGVRAILIDGLWEVQGPQRP